MNRQDEQLKALFEQLNIDAAEAEIMADEINQGEQILSENEPDIPTGLLLRVEHRMQSQLNKPQRQNIGQFGVARRLLAVAAALAVVFGAAFWLHNSHRQDNQENIQNGMIAGAESIYYDEDALWDVTMSMEYNDYNEMDAIMYNAASTPDDSTEAEDDLILNSGDNFKNIV